MTLLIGYDMPYLDLISAIRANYTLCCDWCLSYAGCVAFVWGLPSAGGNVNQCFLKYMIPSSNANSIYVSAHF